MKKIFSFKLSIETPILNEDDLLTGNLGLSLSRIYKNFEKILGANAHEISNDDKNIDSKPYSALFLEVIKIYSEALSVQSLQKKDCFKDVINYLINENQIWLNNILNEFDLVTKYRILIKGLFKLQSENKIEYTADLQSLTTDEKPAKMSIGMPVYNGGVFLSGALDSLLAQNYQDFELIICDNASTDNTLEICNAYINKDSRIKYYRNQDNLGSAKNFQRVLELASGEYFMWAAHDDRWHPDFISKCIFKLEQNPQAILCNTDTFFIDNKGNILEKYSQFSGARGLDTSGMNVVERFSEFMYNFNAFIIYGVFQTSSLKKLFSFPLILGADIILMLRIVLFGDILNVRERLFYYYFDNLCS